MKENFQGKRKFYFGGEGEKGKSLLIKRWKLNIYHMKNLPQWKSRQPENFLPLSLIVKKKKGKRPPSEADFTGLGTFSLEFLLSKGFGAWLEGKNYHHSLLMKKKKIKKPKKRALTQKRKSPSFKGGRSQGRNFGSGPLRRKETGSDLPL